jgi:hypothetical protein
VVRYGTLVLDPDAHTATLEGDQRLRKKLGALGDEIDTVWGVGYRLRPR